MTTVRLYLKLFGEWATGLRERYRSDLFFRTTLQILALQTVLIFASIGVFWYSVYVPRESFWAFAALITVNAGFGILLSRFTLGPARETLHYQKLFISNVAHELRTPLSVIKTSTEVALLDTSMPRSLYKTLTDISGELDRVSEIINNLLSLNNLTRPERMQFSNTELAPIVNIVVRRHQALARERNIKLIVKKDPYTTVWGNATALEQVITNLIKNAVSYTPKGNGGAVTITLRHQDDMMLLIIADTGIGISQEDLFHIFEPFYRADTSRVRRIRKSGSGLGLTIVNEIVRVHHGKIHIQSARKKGTVVSVFLPRGVGRGAPAHLQGKEGEQSELSVDFSRGAVPAHKEP